MSSNLDPTFTVCKLYDTEAKQYCKAGCRPTSGPGKIWIPRLLKSALTYQYGADWPVKFEIHVWIVEAECTAITPTQFRRYKA